MRVKRLSLTINASSSSSSVVYCNSKLLDFHLRVLFGFVLLLKDKPKMVRKQLYPSELIVELWVGEGRRFMVSKTVSLQWACLARFGEVLRGS